jgi:site-specific DNA-cytosine methylase
MFKALDLISEIQPKTFCLEQVPGLGDLPVFNAFEEFKLRLKVDLSEYHVEARAVKALYLNTPQDRTRWVFIGTRKDTGLLPVFPKPIQGSLSHLTIGAIAPEIDYVETKSGKKIMRRENTEFFPTIPATESLTLILIDGTRMRLSEWVELMMKIFGIPEDFHFHPDLSFAEIHRLIGNSVPVPLGRAIFREIVRSLRSL